MKFKRQLNAAVDVNLTPLIDVVFLLLIFFMVSTTFTRETHLSLDLPEASGERAEAQPEQLEIVISADGQYAINDRSLVNNKRETLMQALGEVAGDKRDLPLIVTADANAPHQFVIRALDAAGQMGFSQLSLTAREPQAE